LHKKLLHHAWASSICLYFPEIENTYMKGNICGNHYFIVQETKNIPFENEALLGIS
jgi:hypothetical protein